MYAIHLLETYQLWCYRHTIFIFRCLVSREDAVLKHYRSCRKEWMRNNRDKCDRLIHRIQDTSMFPLAAQIIGRVKAVKHLVKIT